MKKSKKKRPIYKSKTNDKKNYLRVLQSFSCKELFLNLSNPCIDEIINRKYPHWKFKLSDEISANEETRKILKELRKVYFDTSFKIKPLDIQLTSVEYFTIALSIAKILSNTNCKKWEKDSWNLELLKERTSIFLQDENIKNAVNSLLINFDNVLINYNTIDKYIYWYQIILDDKQYTLILHKTLPEKRNIKIDNHNVQVIRCGQCFCTEGIKWVKWDKDQLQFNGTEKNYQVFVENHALRRMKERIDIYEDTPENQGWINEMLWRSLLKPDFYNENNNYMVAFKLGEHKIGYLPFIVQEDMVIIKTFLFLTMNGTPEYSRIQKELRNVKLDKELKTFLGIDKLSTFIFSDVADKGRCRDFFEKCGCGQLFQITEDDFRPKRKFECAGEIEKILNL